MGKEWKLVTFLGIIIAILLTVFFLLSSQKIEVGKICFEKLALSATKCFAVEIAETEAQKHQGLMYRTNLDKHMGMLFIFDQEANYPFWMKNTLISLDIIWINKNKEIVFIAENTEPCRTEECSQINPNIAASYVLELNGGIAKEIGLKVGDTAQIGY